MSEDLVNIYLIGFMGVGKTVIGRHLAQTLGMQFIDADQAIESAHGGPISEIFEKHGEPYFRQMERTFIESGHPPTGCVVACGGGLAVQPGMMELLQRRGVVVSLFASVETILERTGRNDKRPLLNVANREEKIRNLLKEREPVYMQSPIGVSTENRSIHEVVSHVKRMYLEAARDFHKQA